MAPPFRPQSNKSVNPTTIHDPLLEGFLDDLISLDSPRSGGGSQGVAGVGGGVGPASPSNASGGTSSSSPTHWRLTNPVHMEVQENAKLPTFHWTVDRAGSSRSRRDSITGSNANSTNNYPSPMKIDTSSSMVGQGGDGGEEAVQSPSQDVSLAEQFLSTPHRQSYHANYQQAGALRRDSATAFHKPSGSRHNHNHPFSNGINSVDYRQIESFEVPGNSTSNTGNDSQDPLDILAAEVEPTPLSEIRRKHNERHRHNSYGYYPPPSSSGHGHQHYALPIPTAALSSTTPPPPPQPASRQSSSMAGPPSPVESRDTPPPASSSSPPPSMGGREGGNAAGGAASLPSPLVNAVATAAAIASQTPTTTTTTAAAPSTADAGPPPPNQRQQPPPMSLPGPYTTVQQQNNKNHHRSTHHYQSRPSSAGPRLGGRNSNEGTLPNNNSEVTAGSITGALERASQQKTQYGFGAKHVVPSVPLPPTKRGGSVGRSSTCSSPLISSTRTSPIPSSGVMMLGNNHGGVGVGNQGEAYERKKQRAKAARVKLNESIERLSIAIHLAGTQSKQRLTQWQSLPASTDSDNNTNRQASLGLLQECTEIAESAKKWDRPSFVGAAASLIQGLNAQCEHLMQELMACHETMNLKNGKSNSVNGAAAAPPESATSAKRPPDKSDNTDYRNNSEPSNKRMKVDNDVCTNGIHHLSISNGNSNNIVDLTMDNGDKQVVNDNETSIPTCDHPIFGDLKIVTRVSSFLDPPTLVGCFQVSKYWKKAFAKQESWQEMAIRRFGHYNVRQWRGKLDDEDENISCLPLTLYRSMNDANVMPHFSHEGMFLLGEARLPGKVSAWTFLVERSNGETLRSVKKRENDDGAAGGSVFTSLPVVELRTVIQNTGSIDEPVVLKDQLQTVDASTRRRGVEMKEIDWDDRFEKRVLNLDGTERQPGDGSASGPAGSKLDVCRILGRLELFDSIVLQTYIHAKGCSTTSKFVQRSNFTKILVQIRNGTTVPMVIPFPRDASHHLEH